MKERLSSRVVYYVGFGVWYLLLSHIIGFEWTVMLCMGTIIGEQSYLAKLNRNKDD